MKTPKTFGFHSPNPFLLLKELPPSLLVLRAELYLPCNIDIFQAAAKQPNFEACIGEIALKLDIALDGEYEPDALFTMLTEAMRNRFKHSAQPWKRAEGLIPAEMEEREGEVEIVERKEEDATTLVPGIHEITPERDSSSCSSGVAESDNEVGKDENDVAIH